MHIKFLRHGTGSAAKAAAYLLGERDHKGVDRDHVQVLIGDPTQVAAVADSLGTVHRYSSAVIAFHPDDRPTPEQIAGVLADFEALAFAGLPADGYAWTAVQHGRPDSGDGVHVHVLIARVELTSGLAYNPAPPSWRTHFDHVRDAWNHEQGWARPDDPTRARLVQPPAHEMFKAAAAARAGQTKGVDPRALLTGWVVDQVAAGRIVDRPTLLTALAEHVEITRAGKDYVSVRLAPDTKPIRLKGALYVHDFTTTRATTDQPAPGDDRGSASAAAGLQPSGPGRDPAGSAVADAGLGRADAGPAGHARARLEHARQRRADFNQRRYRVPAESHPAGRVDLPTAGPPVADLAPSRGDQPFDPDPGRLPGPGLVDRAGHPSHHDHKQEGTTDPGADGHRVDHLYLAGHQAPLPPPEPQVGDPDNDRARTTTRPLADRARRAIRAADSTHQRLGRPTPEDGAAVGAHGRASGPPGVAPNERLADHPNLTQLIAAIRRAMVDADQNGALALHGHVVELAPGLAAAAESVEANPDGPWHHAARIAARLSQQPAPPGQAATGASDGAAPARDGFARLLGEIAFGMRPAALTHTDRELARAYHVFQILMRAWDEWDRQRALRTLNQPVALPVRTVSRPGTWRTQARSGHLHH